MRAIERFELDRIRLRSFGRPNGCDQFAKCSSASASSLLNSSVIRSTTRVASGASSETWMMGGISTSPATARPSFGTVGSRGSIVAAAVVGGDARDARCRRPRMHGLAEDQRRRLAVGQPRRPRRVGPWRAPPLLRNVGERDRQRHVDVRLGPVQAPRLPSNDAKGIITPSRRSTARLNFRSARRPQRDQRRPPAAPSAEARRRIRLKDIRADFSRRSQLLVEDFADFLQQVVARERLGEKVVASDHAAFFSALIPARTS